MFINVSFCLLLARSLQNPLLLYSFYLITLYGHLLKNKSCDKYTSSIMKGLDMVSYIACPSDHWISKRVLLIKR